MAKSPAPCWVTAQRGNDLYFPEEFGKLYGFSFHRREVPYGPNQVRVKFPSWAVAQSAVAKFRTGDVSLWEASCS